MARFSTPQQEARHDSARERVLAALPVACPAARLCAHPPLRLPQYTQAVHASALVFSPAWRNRCGAGKASCDHWTTIRTTRCLVVPSLPWADADSRTLERFTTSLARPSDSPPNRSLTPMIFRYTHLKSMSHASAFTRRVTFLARLTQHGNFTSTLVTYCSLLPLLTG